VSDGGAERTTTRPGRCAVHPGSAEVGRCDVCGRSLCLTCAVPVRGSLVGPECLATVLEDAPPPVPAPVTIPARGDRMAAAGFALVLVASIFPWSRFGDTSGYLEAWRVGWSLPAVGAAAAGLAFAVMAWRRPMDARLEALAYAALAVVSGIAAYLHHHHPPPLSSPSFTPFLGIAGAAVALLGAVRKAASLVAARRPLP